MAYSWVANVAVTGANGGTTASRDTTGATLLIAVVSYYVGSAAPTVSDSNTNTWTGLTLQAGGEVGARIYYAKNPTVGAGHTFTVSGASSFSTGQFAAFSGADTAAPFDVENGATNAGNQSSIQPGSTGTPSQANSLIIAGLGGSAPSSGYTIDSSFNVTDTNNYTGGVNEGGGAAYLIQGAAAAVNPTWSFSSNGGNGASAAIAVFKPAAAAPTPYDPWPLWMPLLAQ